MGDAKKKYRIEGIAIDHTSNSPADGIKKYAETIEETMNRLHEEGYEVSLFEQEDSAGMLIIGKLPLEQQASPLSRLAQALGAVPVVLGGGAEDAERFMTLSKRTATLVSRFVRVCPSVEPKSFGIEARKAAPEIVKGFTSEELITATAEVVKEATEHEKNHKPGSECELPALLRVLAAVLSETAQAQLQ